MDEDTHRLFTAQERPSDDVVLLLLTYVEQADQNFCVCTIRKTDCGAQRSSLRISVLRAGKPLVELTSRYMFVERLASLKPWSNCSLAERRSGDLAAKDQKLALGHKRLTLLNNVLRFAQP